MHRAAKSDDAGISIPAAGMTYTQTTANDPPRREVHPRRQLGCGWWWGGGGWRHVSPAAVALSAAETAGAGPGLLSLPFSPLPSRMKPAARGA